MAVWFVAPPRLPELLVVAEVLLTMGEEQVVLQPQHPSQHGQVLVLHNGRTVRGLVPLT
jgi:hypothetical protein